MKIGNSSPPSRPYSARSVNRTGGVSAVNKPSSVGAYSGTNLGIGQFDNIQDRIEILGIDPADLTPKVQATMLKLMEEVDGLKRQLDSTSKRIRELEELADLDPLLPIRNRRAFVRELSRMISFAERYQTPSTIMFIDLNDMKHINDHYGHDVGDQALFHLACLISDNIRGTDVIGRLGGDEFGVILAQSDEKTGMEKAQAIANLVMSTPMVIDKNKPAESGSSDSTTPGSEQKLLYLKLAFGTYTLKGGEKVSDALEKADQAMYRNKQDMKDDNKAR